MTDEINPLAEEVYQQYHSFRPSMRMNTPEGGVITFMHHKCITKVPAHIEYLDSEIAAGNRHIYQEEVDKNLTADDLDPMVALKRKHIKEYLEQEAQQLKDSESAPPAPPANVTKVATTAVLAATAASNSKAK